MERHPIDLTSLKITENKFDIKNPNIKISRANTGLCGTGSNKYFSMVVPNRVTPRGGEFLCQTLNAEMYLPLTKKNFYEMLNGTDSNVLAKCPLFYTPFQLNEDEKWVDRKGKAKPSTLPWSTSEPNGAGLQRCTHIRPDNYAIYDIFCESSAAGCPICKFTEKPVLLLKGTYFDKFNIKLLSLSNFNVVTFLQGCVQNLA